jgi:hypothetical protein
MTQPGQDLLAAIRTAIEAAGLAWRGAFHPEPGDGVPVACGTLVLLGFVGHAQWPGFERSAEAADGAPDPLDRWSRRVVRALAAALGGSALFPFGGPPFLPFHLWARRAEPVFTSPLGLLIHPVHGLWHSYRGAIAFAERLDLPATRDPGSPCDSCAGRPCLSACPVGAFTGTLYRVGECVAHLRTAAGTDCLSGGCLARRACPIGEESRYGDAEAAFHMRSFLAAQR